jgi:Zn-dependent protease
MPIGPEAPLQNPAPLPGPTPEYYPPSYTPEPAGKPPWLKRAGGAIVTAGIVVLNFGAKLKGLLLLLPKLKLFTTSASMLVSIGAYSLLFGWKFAVGFVLLLLVHEYGHVLQLRREGIPASAPLFIPFLGAVVGMKRLPDDAAAEARVGLAGPVLGTIGCLVPLGLWFATGSEFWQALAFTGFFLNLFNLLPVLPLDGGRAMSALSPWIWAIGFAILVGTAIAFPNPILLLIVLFGGLETWRRWKERKSPEAKRYYRVKPRTRVIIAVVYIGLAAALAVGMGLTHLERDFGDV